MFVLVSFDYGDSESVTLHAVTTDGDHAQELYERLAKREAERWPAPREEGPWHKLVELLEVQNDFASVNGAPLFWGASHPDVRVVRSNNR